jgi:hypothetical protein
VTTTPVLTTPISNPTFLSSTGIPSTLTTISVRAEPDSYSTASLNRSSLDSSTSAPGDTQDGLGTFAIIGIIFGVVITLAIIGLIIYRKIKDKRTDNEESGVVKPSPSTQNWVAQPDEHGRQASGRRGRGKDGGEELLAPYEMGPWKQ